MSKTIFISAGHSDVDPGACAHGHTEEGIVTELRDNVAKAVRAAGILCATDGDLGKNLPLAQAIKIAKTCTGPRVEFHLNAGPATAKGVECLSMPDQRILSKILATTIGSVMQIPLRGDGGWKPDNAGQHHRLAFCREAKGIIVEVFFISNKAELDHYLANKDAIAQAIAKVLIKAAEV